MPLARHPAAQNAELLREGERLVARLPDAAYAAAPRGLAFGGAGAQFRHVIDFYDCFRTGYARGAIDYDRRARDARLESDRQAACRAAGDLARWLDGLVAADAARPLDVAHDGGDLPERWQRSTVGRELRFLASHTIHHYALIRLLLWTHGIAAPPSWGVAPATLAHRRSEGPCAR